MSFTAKLLVVIITVLVTLEGLIVCLWPQKVKKLIQLGTPGQLRGAGLVEFLIGAGGFIYCLFNL
jgi:uncharacterized protein YjeT (DUF2065 family)